LKPDFPKIIIDTKIPPSGIPNNNRRVRKFFQLMGNPEPTTKGMARGAHWPKIKIAPPKSRRFFGGELGF
jgi:hypothetical protein